MAWRHGETRPQRMTSWWQDISPDIMTWYKLFPVNSTDLGSADSFSQRWRHKALRDVMEWQDLSAWRHGNKTSALTWRDTKSFLSIATTWVPGSTHSLSQWWRHKSDVTSWRQDRRSHHDVVQSLSCQQHRPGQRSESLRWRSNRRRLSTSSHRLWSDGQGSNISIQRSAYLSQRADRPQIR